MWTNSKAWIAPLGLVGSIFLGAPFASGLGFGYGIQGRRDLDVPAHPARRGRQWVFLVRHGFERWTAQSGHEPLGFSGPEQAHLRHDPTSLARAVQILAIAAIGVLVWFSYRCVPSGEREPWLWAAAILSVNPLAVLFERKIWPPSVLPIFVSFMLIAWWKRERFWGAFAWGLIGAWIGQIHMGAFFFAGGFAAWALLFDRKQVAWRGWLAGSFLGASR